MSRYDAIFTGGVLRERTLGERLRGLSAALGKAAAVAACTVAGFAVLLALAYLFAVNGAMADLR